MRHRRTFFPLQPPSLPSSNSPSGHTDQIRSPCRHLESTFAWRRKSSLPLHRTARTARQQATNLHCNSAGESHGKTVSCIIENCPPGLSLVESDIQGQLNRRRPGQSAITTPRDEKDRVTIGSGCEFGRTYVNPTGSHNICHDADTLGSQIGHTHTPDRAQ